MSTVGPIEIHEALDGLDFPATKEQILAHVDRKADFELARSTLDTLPDERFASIEDIDTALADTHYS